MKHRRLNAIGVRLSIVLSLIAMLPMWLQILADQGRQPFFTVPMRSTDTIRAISLTAFIVGVALLGLGGKANRPLSWVAALLLGVAFIQFVQIPSGWVVSN